MCSVRSEKLHESSQAVKPAVSKEEVKVAGGGAAGAAEKKALKVTDSDARSCAEAAAAIEVRRADCCFQTHLHLYPHI